MLVRVITLTTFALCSFSAGADPYTFFQVEYQGAPLSDTAEVFASAADACQWFDDEGTYTNASNGGTWTLESAVLTGGGTQCTIDLTTPVDQTFDFPIATGNGTCPGTETFNFTTQSCDDSVVGEEQLTLSEALLASGFAVMVFGLGWLVGGADGRGV